MDWWINGLVDGGIGGLRDWWIEGLIFPFGFDFQGSGSADGCAKQY
jgi:hypothetical protein